MRDIVKGLAEDQATDAEIEAALDAMGQPRMTAAEVHDAVQARMAGRANLRATIMSALNEPPQVARARELLDATLDRIETKLKNDEYVGTELIRLGRWLSSLVVVPRAAALAASFEAGRQYLGFTQRGYDDELRTEAERAELAEAADREEKRREQEENMH